ESKFAKDAEVISGIENLANTETDKKTKAAAIRFLGKLKDARYKDLFAKNVSDSSYTVSGAALQALIMLEPEAGYTLAKKYSNDAKGDLGDAISEIIMSKGNESDFEFILNLYDKSAPSQDKLTSSETFCAFLGKVNNLANVKKGIDAILRFRALIPEQYRGFTDPSFKAGFDKLSKAKGTEIADYIAKGMK
ncbi:MAG: HEAT repeat domain-containing protein, partial [Sphingobacteriales bacterium]|nr:HEAT repeat domain-containing protein [Sphingobacteriales bacterium]